MEPSGLALVCAQSWILCRIVCVSPKGNEEGCGQYSLPLWGVGVRFDHILYLQKGGRNVPILSGYVSVTHVNKYIDAPGVLVCGAQKGLSDV